MATGSDNSTSCAIARLPLELLRQVFFELADQEDQYSLRSCITVSQDWHEVALPVFLRRVVILHHVFKDRFALFGVWLQTHKDMRKNIKVLEFTADIYLDRRNAKRSSHIDVFLDTLKDVLPDLPALDELHLTRAIILAPSTLSSTTPPRPIRALTLHATENPYETGDDDEVVGGYNYGFGLSMFSALSAMLSLVAPDTLVLKGGYTFLSNPPGSFPAPTNMKIRRLDLGEYWLDLPYWRGHLAPGTLEHFTAMWPWRDRNNDRAHQFHALMESVGTAVRSIQLCMYHPEANMVYFMLNPHFNEGEDWGLLGRTLGACTRLRSLALRMPVYALMPGEQADDSDFFFGISFPPQHKKKFYSSVFSAVPRSLRKLKLVLDVETPPCSRANPRLSQSQRITIDALGLEALGEPWVLERFARLERVEVVIPTGPGVVYGCDEVLETKLRRMLGNLSDAGILRIVKVPSGKVEWMMP